VATEVKRYLASDGKQFDSALDADNHDAAVAFCLAIHPSNPQEFYKNVIKALNAGWTIEPPHAEMDAFLG